MRTIATVSATLAAALGALALGVPVLAQGEVPAFCHAQDPGDPDYDITEYDPQRDADDWCKLAYHEPHKARRQLSKAVALVRSENNPNRYYFDPKHGSPPGFYIQLLRPWMAEQNAAGTAAWRVTQSESTSTARLNYRFLIEDTTDSHTFIFYIQPQRDHDSYSPPMSFDRRTASDRRGIIRTLRDTVHYCRHSESAPVDRSNWTAAELKSEVEYILGHDDGPNCEPY